MALPPGLNSGIFGGQLVNTKPDPNLRLNPTPIPSLVM